MSKLEEAINERINNKSELWKDLFSHYTYERKWALSMIDWPEGWTDIVQRLHDDLVKIVPNYRLHQVKEKLAELRLYASAQVDLDSPVDEDIDKAFDDRINKASMESRKVCMWCGGEGKRYQPRSWMFVACEACIVANFDEEGCPIR